MLVASGDPANPTVVAEGIKITATFNPDGTVNGSGGCNNYTGGYTLAGDQISVGPLASTMMFCETGQPGRDGLPGSLAASQDLRLHARRAPADLLSIPAMAPRAC